jgi:hypothetical protein
MKIAALVTAVALASGAALAAQSSTDSGAATTRSSTATEQTQPKGGGIIEKTKRALHRMGDKMRSVGRKASDRDKDAQAKDNDTRNMGAAGSDTQDSARQRRMDDAYANWQSKPKQ